MQMSRLDLLIKLLVMKRAEREAEEQLADLFDLEVDTIPPHVRTWMAQQGIHELGAPAPQPPTTCQTPTYQQPRPQLPQPPQQPQQPQTNGQLPPAPPHRKQRRAALPQPPQQYQDPNAGGQQ